MKELLNGHYPSPRWSYEFLDCSMPISLDTYSNCSFTCLYCFSGFQRSLGINDNVSYLQKRARSVNVDKIKRMFLEPDKYAGQFARMIKKRYTIQWGGLSDAFDLFEKEYGKSLELLQFFRQIEYPISISTKGTWIMQDERYLKELKDADHIHFKVSIITANKEKAARIEKGVSSPDERFEMLRQLKELGIGGTTLRLRPFILGASDDGLEALIEKAAEVGCYSISTEFLCLEGRTSVDTKTKMEELSQIIGYDALKFYRKHSSGSGLMRLNYEIKRPFIDRMQLACDKYGLKLFVSDAHHKERSFGPSCCGIAPNNPKLNNYQTGTYTQALLIAKEKGYVLWKDIEKPAKVLDNAPLKSAEGFNQGTTLFRAQVAYETLYDRMHTIWNTTKSAQSPGKYFGGALIAAGLDSRGDVVYLYNRPYIDEKHHCRSVNELAGKLELDLGAICAE
jgi:DNA repair photolyase